MLTPMHQPAGSKPARFLLNPVHGNEIPQSLLTFTLTIVENFEHLKVAIDLLSAPSERLMMEVL